MALDCGWVRGSRGFRRQATSNGQIAISRKQVRGSRQTAAEQILRTRQNAVGIHRRGDPLSGGGTVSAGPQDDSSRGEADGVPWRIEFILLCRPCRGFLLFWNASHRSAFTRYARSAAGRLTSFAPTTLDCGGRRDVVISGNKQLAIGEWWPNRACGCALDSCAPATPARGPTA